MTVLILGFAAMAATFLGGLFAIRFRDKLHLILGFSAGAVIGVALFDLLPEALEFGESFRDVSTTTALVAAGFLFYLFLDRTVSLHGHEKETLPNPARGFLGAGSLSVHSFLDGFAIGLAFQVSAAAGVVVAVAVLVHDFSDGINTVNLILKNGGTRKTALRFLAADALAPLLGAASTLLFTFPEYLLGLILALFTGFFLYIGASDLVPESHHAHPRFLTTASTLLGAGVLYLAVTLAGI